MDRSYIIYILIYIIFHFKHDVLITEKPLRGVFNKVLSYLICHVRCNQPNNLTELIYLYGRKLKFSDLHFV